LSAGESGDGTDIGDAGTGGEGVVGIDDDDGGGVRENGVRESNEFQYEFEVAPDPFSLD